MVDQNIFIIKLNIYLRIRWAFLIVVIYCLRRIFYKAANVVIYTGLLLQVGVFHYRSRFVYYKLKFDSCNKSGSFLKIMHQKNAENKYVILINKVPGDGVLTIYPTVTTSKLITYSTSVVRKKARLDVGVRFVTS